MTTRERFRRVMAGDAAVDRLPAIEWAYWWDKTLELWYGQGLPRGLDEAAMADFVGIDRNTQFWLPHKTPDCPRETSHGRGIVENESDYERLRPYLLPENAVQQMLPKIRQTLPFYENGQTLVWYTLDGLFWWPRTLLGIENHLYSFYDQPELYHRICEDLLEWQIAQVDALARYMKPDFMTIAEDMSYNHGPMLSEELFNEFIKPYYQRLIPEIKKHGTRARKKEKQNAARDSNYQEWQDIQGLLDKIRSTGMGGISADDPQAVQKLEKKLESLEKSQETMKAVNAYYRKHKTLDGCPHLPPEELEKLKADMASSWHLEDKPFATWALSNNSAEIRRVKDRIKSLSQQKEIGFVGWEFDGGKVEANTEANRLQIFFEDKPDEATREALKSNGFRWSPKAGAWQRQLTSNAYYAADYVKSIQPLTGEKPIGLQRAHIRAQKVASQEHPVQEQPEQKAPQDKDTFSIYQIKGGDETRDLRFEPYDRLTAAGYRVDMKNYALVYSAPLTPGTSLEDIYTRFNIDHPKDFKGHSLSVSDVVVLHQNGQDTAHYVDSFGYKKVPEFLQPENYLKTAEQTTEQNYNMIDGQINNTPTVAELEAKVKTGETISLVDLAETVKADKERGKAAKTEKKPSIRAQLKAAKEQTPKKQAKQKTQDLERS